MIAQAWAQRRRALVAALTTAAVMAFAGSPSTGAPSVAANGTAIHAGLHDPANALRSAERMSTPIAVPPGPVAPELAQAIEKNTVSFNTCTGNLVRDDQGAVLGIVGAAHCVRQSSNVVQDGHTFGTGTSVIIDRADIRLDSTTDMFYAGLDGRAAADVHAQLVLNYAQVDLTDRSSNQVAVMTGYPRFSNERNEPVTIPLSLSGIVHWPHDLADTIATFGDWNSENQSCSPGASGSGLYHHIDGHGYVIIGVLSSRAEFEQVQTMTYSADYGLELRRYFETQLGRTIDADFLCGFAPPTEP